MTEEELRCLVRNAIAQHLGSAISAAPMATPQEPPLWRSHPSFGKFLVASGADQAGPCLIEPKVACNHCGFCKSYGH